MTQGSLLPDRHPTQDFFIADIFDNLPIKDDMASMAHPIFSLTTQPDKRVLEYKNGDTTVSIIPSVQGLPTVHDKDVLLYCASQVMAALNQDRKPPKTIRISTHNLLVTTNRKTSGAGYALLKKALDRLVGVRIKTNIKTNKEETTRSFGLLESYEIIESSRVKNRMVKLEITLSDWFYNSLIGREVVTINRDYFRLRKAVDRRVYEIARKHCGRKPEWPIKLEKLTEKIGSTSTLNKVRFLVRQMIKTDHLPDYTVSLSDNDLVTFKRRSAAPLLDLDDMPHIKPETIAKGAKIVRDVGTGWDYQEIRTQFTRSLMNGFDPDKVDGAFINFVKNKVRQS